MKRLFNPYLCVLLLALLGAAGFFAARGASRARTASRDGVAMDTLISISVAAPKPERGASDLNGVLDEVFGLIQDLDAALSMTHPDGALKSLNAAAAGTPVTVPRDLYRALEAALELADITGGAYDPTIGAVTALWRDGHGGFRVPKSADLARAAALADPSGVVLAPPDAVTRVKRGVTIDLGGIGKGVASQRAANLLRRRGIASALINLGGNVVAVGGKPDGTPWRIGIQDPSKPRGTPLAAVRARNTSVITAGVYERTWEADGVTYTHIFDPDTGRPISGDLLSVTVIADDAVAGDALSTAFMVMGPPRALELLRILPGVEAVFVSASASEKSRAKAYDVLATGGLRDSLELLNRGCALSFAEVE